MKQLNLFILLTLSMLLFSCSDGDLFSGEYSDLGLYGEASGSSTGEGSNDGEDDKSGLITAGEWNDLENWDFWLDLVNGQDYGDKEDYWGFYTRKRILVEVKDGLNPLVDAKVELKKNNQNLWTARTDNKGRAELWVSLFDKSDDTDLSELKLFISGNEMEAELVYFEDGINEFQMNSSVGTLHDVEIAFIVDATGSMSDELEFLKQDLEDVIVQVEIQNPAVNINTAAVFYRDEGDEYLVKFSDFEKDPGATIDFIRDQKADGGGDYPEAVHTALNVGLYDLNWSIPARTRIAFLLLDAPPHYESDVTESIRYSIKGFAEKGIKVVPITASGVNKETEFLMRFFSISTNGTYVFITDHSGIGNDHLEPSIGEYEVEYLNDLLIRLIGEMSF